MDLSAIELYDTTPSPPALPGMRVVSRAGTFHLQCPLEGLDPDRSLDDWKTWALTLGPGLTDDPRRTSGAPLRTMKDEADRLDAPAVARLLAGQSHLPPHLAQDFSKFLLVRPLNNALRIDIKPSMVEPGALGEALRPLNPLESQRAIVGMMLTSGARPDLRTLHAAVRSPNPRLLRRLLDLPPQDGWDLTAVENLEGGTPLHTLADNHWSTAPELVDLLLDAGVPIDQPNIDDGTTALSLAVQRQAWWVVRRLLERGADPDVADISNTTPLHLAARNDDARSLRLLLAAGATPEPRLTNGNSPMNEAGRRGAVHALQTLLDHGLDPLADRERTKYPWGRTMTLARMAADAATDPTHATNAQACVALLEGWQLRQEANAVTNAQILSRSRPRSRL